MELRELGRELVITEGITFLGKLVIVAPEKKPSVRDLSLKASIDDKDLALAKMSNVCMYLWNLLSLK